MTLEKFTIKAQETVQQAVLLAQQNGQQSIEPVHLMAALLDKGRDVVGFVFQKLGMNAGQIEMLCQQEIRHLARVQGGEPYLSADANKVLLKAQDLAREMGDEYVSCEPILLALLLVNSTVSRILKDGGATEKDMRQAILELRQGQRVQSQSITISRWRSMPRTSSAWQGQGSWILSSDVMTRYAACCRSSHVVRRTTLSS